MRPGGTARHLGRTRHDRPRPHPRAWSAAPFGVGIVCGPSGLIVLDLDVPKPGAKPLPESWRLPGVVDGADMLCVLAERAGQPVPLDTRTVATPSGGLQLYYTAPEGIRLGNTAKHLAPLIDTRAWGGQVVAPPTPRDDGIVYALTLDTPPTAFPTWLLNLLPPLHTTRAHPQGRRPPAPVVVVWARPDHPRPRGG